MYSQNTVLTSACVKLKARGPDSTQFTISSSILNILELAAHLWQAFIVLQFSKKKKKNWAQFLQTWHSN